MLPGYGSKHSETLQIRLWSIEKFVMCLHFFGLVLDGDLYIMKSAYFTTNGHYSSNPESKIIALDFSIKDLLNLSALEFCSGQYGLDESMVILRSLQIRATSPMMNSLALSHLKSLI